MATLVLTAVGTFIGGPIGGAVGSLIGGQIDAAIFGPGDREGPRLKELAVTTSSYGTPIPRHFGTMRSAGSVIWATDLVETSEKVGGGKGQPSTKTYSYSSSFAVALSSRPVLSVGRIWADGNLLRGEAGDLKTGGTMRFYEGRGDQQPDPLIAAAEGANCPAFRGLSYLVFEDLQLADFGNRLPSLTFEVIAENGNVRLIDILAESSDQLAVDRELQNLEGFSDEGGSLGNALTTISSVYPLASDASAGQLRVFSPDTSSATPLSLPASVIDPSEESFGAGYGSDLGRKTSNGRIPSGIRYYDTERDFQAGLQLAGGRALGGTTRLIEFPGALSANNARALAEVAAKRARSSHDHLSYRIADIDPALSPGSQVIVPERDGIWRVEAWEWREFGLELSLTRLPPAKTPQLTTDAGRALTPVDAQITPSLLRAFALPWDGTATSDTRQIFAAASSMSPGWNGAMLYAENGDALEPLGASGKERSITGSTTTQLAPSKAIAFDRNAEIEVQLDAPDFVLNSVDMDSLAQGANRALIGEEVIQFASVESLGNGLWRLCGLLRGRGGTEHLAFAPLPAGSAFILLDDTLTSLDDAAVATSTRLAAIGLVDEEPVFAEIAAINSTLRPLAPVHARVLKLPDGSMRLCWTRRARGAWRWEGTVETPLVEQSELYEIGFGNPDTPNVVWTVELNEFSLSAIETANLVANYGSGDLWVRQIGTHARSLPTLLTILN